MRVLQGRPPATTLTLTLTLTLTSPRSSECWLRVLKGRPSPVSEPHPRSNTSPSPFPSRAASSCLQPHPTNLTRTITLTLTRTLTLTLTGRSVRVTAHLTGSVACPFRCEVTLAQTPTLALTLTLATTLALTRLGCARRPRGKLIEQYVLRTRLERRRVRGVRLDTGRVKGADTEHAHRGGEQLL